MVQRGGITLLVTEDGSHTLRNEALDETYHSTHGAWTESVHVFIRAGLQHVLSSLPPSFTILEIGLGTGLNAALTMSELFPLDNKSVLYHAIELYPVEAHLVDKLNYDHFLPPYAYDGLLALHHAPWGSIFSLSSTFSVLKQHISLQELVLAPKSVHLVYFDAFAPSKQPDMWDISHLKKLYDALVPGGVLVTYCAKGQFRRDCQSLGFTVERIPGPPGKREMVRATKRV